MEFNADKGTESIPASSDDSDTTQHRNGAPFMSLLLLHSMNKSMGTASVRCESLCHPGVDMRVRVSIAVKKVTIFAILGYFPIHPTDRMKLIIITLQLVET